MKRFKKGLLTIDSIFESIALTGLLALVFIVTMQVLTRKLFNFVFFWSEEITLLLMVWFSFMGIAIGFREKLHLGIDSFTNLFPKRFNQVLDKIIYLSIFAFGGYLIYYGWSFTKMMNESVLAATGLPNSIVYFVMPVTGLMTCCYSLLQLCGLDTRRHSNIGGGHE